MLSFRGLVFIEDPNGTFPRDHRSAPYRSNAVLPADARSTGYRSGGRALWVSPAEPDAVYLLSGSKTERLPSGDLNFGCD
jgi:hypothetical protein